VWCVAAYLLALAATVFFLGAVTPMPEMTNVTSKYRYVAANRTEIDTLFIGSSRFFHGFIPKLFEETVTTLTGRQVRAFNFGVSGMWPPESFYMLREILALRPTRLRWVFIDLMDIDTRGVKPGGVTRRLTFWHDQRHTAMVAARIGEQPVSSSEKATLIRAHYVIQLRRLVNFGSGGERLIGRMTRNNFAKGKDWAKGLGYDTGDANIATGDKLDEYGSALTRLQQAGPPPAMSPTLERAVLDIASEVRATGAIPIFVSCADADLRQRFAAQEAGLELWAFNDPARYPQLFDPAMRHDPVHLTPQGAALFTQLLAERFAERLKNGP